MSSAHPRHVAIATCGNLADLVEEDRILVQHLAKRNIVGVPAVWTDPKVDWSDFDAVLIRSIWDYHLRFSEFEAWLDRLDDADCLTINSTALMRWNAHKSYLHELLDMDRRIVPTRVISKGEQVELGEVIRKHGWDRWVTKPAISASAAATHLWTMDDLPQAEAHWRQMLAKRDMLIQPWIEAVQSGEWSLVFFDGEYSHAVIKQPAAGEFRVQAEFGGRHKRATPSAAALDEASRAVMLLDNPPYARVDGYSVDDGEWIISEMELIEPALFLQEDPKSFARFADVIQAQLDE